MSKTYVSYVPHGIDSLIFKPIDKTDPEFLLFKNKVLRNKLYLFILFYNNRNIRRKCTSNLMLAYKFFVNELPQLKKDKVLLLLHTHPIDQHGTNLLQVHLRLLPECNIIIDGGSYIPKEMNYLYNIVDITTGISSAEGFGLATALSLMAGVPVIINATGGLQDQVRFLGADKLIQPTTREHPSNSDGKNTCCGE